MGETTKMYIEHIVIGLQTTLLIVFMFACLDSSIVPHLKELSSVMELIVVIPISYALGIIVDRVCNYVLFCDDMEELTKIEKCEEVFQDCIGAYKCSQCKRDIFSRELWKEFNEMEYYNDVISRKRIIRATLFNSSCGIIMITALLYSDSLIFSPFYGALLAVLFVIAMTSYIVYIKLIGDYYKKQKKYTKLCIDKKSQNNN